MFANSAIIVFGALMINYLHVGYFCMLFLSSADFFFTFQKYVYRRKTTSIGNTIRVVNSLNPDQDRH